MILFIIGLALIVVSVLMMINVSFYQNILVIVLSYVVGICTILIGFSVMRYALLN